MLITAGPTHEPIDAVRFIGNRSSGRLGVALAMHAAAAGWEVTLLLGPTTTPLPPTPAVPPTARDSTAQADSHPRVVRFRTTTDLERLLAEHWPESDVLIMAAAVADYRPKPAPDRPDAAEGKLRRTGEDLILHLESTPDLLAGCGRSKRPGQMLVGFALEPRSRLMESAAAKLARKRIDLIVANPLETMDAPTIEAAVLGNEGVVAHTEGAMSKETFAPWLLALIERRMQLAGQPAGIPQT